MVGGKVGSMGSNARLGKSDFLLVEADESDGSFLRLAPILAVITNVDREHLDHYQSDADIENAFVEFANKVPFYGSTLVCLDDPMLRRLIPRMTRRVRSYGRSPDADLVVGDIEHGRMRSHFSLRFQGRELGPLRGDGRRLAQRAQRRGRRASGARAWGHGGSDPRGDCAASSASTAASRFGGERNGVTVIDDYGHHPTEIRATLAAARHCGFNRIHVIFQPHRYSRTELLEAEFAAAFPDCDTLEVVDIYAASEEPRPGVNSVHLVDKIREAGSEASYAPHHRRGG